MLQVPPPIIQVPPPTAFTIDAPKPGNAVRKTKATKQPCTEVIFAAESRDILPFTNSIIDIYLFIERLVLLQENITFLLSW